MSEFSKKRNWGPRPNYPLVENYTPPNSDFIVIAGPCSVESKEQIHEIAKIVADNGATHLRGGVFRAGTYPGKSFGYINEMIIEEYANAAQKHGLRNIIEVLDYTPESLYLAARHSDCFQVGARSMQNYSLLRKLGDYGRQIFIKRSSGATVDEWLGAAEHVLTGSGFADPVFIERGSSTLHNDVRWTPCVHTIPSVQSICNVPVIMDASHGTGRRDLVEPMTLAGVAAGANGILVEVHTDPEKSISDADQAISPKDFEKLMKKVMKTREAVCAV